VPLTAEPLLVAAAVAVVVLVALAALFVVVRRSGRGGPVRSVDLDGLDLGAALGPLDARLSILERRLAGVEDRTDALEAASRVAVSRVGLVRFNPFEDTGGNQSFALALLDAAGDGVVVSSLHARSGTRIYAKAIRAGRATTALSEEEADAVRQALGERPG
jgi:hypothetical protein